MYTTPNKSSVDEEFEKNWKMALLDTTTTFDSFKEAYKHWYIVGRLSYAKEIEAKVEDSSLEISRRAGLRAESHRKLVEMCESLINYYASGDEAYSLFRDLDKLR